MPLRAMDVERGQSTSPVLIPFRHGSWVWDFLSPPMVLSTAVSNPDTNCITEGTKKEKKTDKHITI